MKSQRENHCGKKELLVAYLYHEANAAERTEFERHQATCASCHDELQAFTGVRGELQAWEMPFIPAIEVVTPRTAMDALRDFFRLVPGWLKLTSGLATATAAALVILALTGTRISVGQGGVDAQFGLSATTQATTANPAALPAVPLPANLLSRAEAEKMMQAAVTQARAEAQTQTRQQLLQLEAKLTAAQQAKLQSATLQLRKDHQKQLLTELARLDNRTMTEWLLTATDTSAEGGAGNEKNQ